MIFSMNVAKNVVNSKQKAYNPFKIRDTYSFTFHSYIVKAEVYLCQETYPMAYTPKTVCCSEK